MASIFLSYARSDVAIAERIAQALEAAGHSVWWDQAIHAGSRFSAEIEEALEAADVVIVLWSVASVKSAWVHDEASVGRDSGKLVPVLIEDIQPPLGFRQYQALNLKGKHRGSVSALQPLVDAVTGKAGETPEVRFIASRRPAWPKFGWRVSAAVIGVVLLVAATAWLVLLRDDNGGGHGVVVEAAVGGDPARSAEMARTIAADLGQFRAGPLGALAVLRSGEADGRADYRVEVGISGTGSAVRADVALVSPKQSQLLWSATVEGQANHLTELRQQAVARIGDVLACAIELEPHKKAISGDALGLYLDACSKFSDLYIDEPDLSILSIFRQVTKKAPKFAPAWAKLAFIEGSSFAGTAPSDRPALRKAAEQHLTIARRLDPSLPEIFAADAQFYPNDGTKPGRGLAILERGLERNPDSALLHGQRSEFLAALGRMNEAVAAAESARNLKPLSPIYHSAYISSLAYAGRTGPAFEELRKAEAIWPESTVLSDARYRLELRYGDPKSALHLLQERGAGDLRPVPMDTAWKSFIEARMDPTPGRKNAALKAFRERHRRDPADVPGFIQALGTFGHVDEAFEATRPAESVDSLIPNTDMLFRPNMHSVRSDPRFIELAHRLGLLTYWRKSRVWPDFCGEPRLPYDCREEGAKFPLKMPPIPQFHEGL